MTTLIMVFSTVASALSVANALPLGSAPLDHSDPLGATVSQPACHEGDHHASAAPDRVGLAGLNLDSGCASWCCHMAWALGGSPPTLEHRYALGTAPALPEPVPLGRTVAPDTPPPIV